MLRIRRAVKVLRNNWKKSVFGAMVLSYGGHVVKERHECNIMMRNYCQEAMKFGHMSEEAGGIRKVTVFLNPAANVRKCKKNFDKFCGPLLYLAGIQVDIVRTKSEGEACDLAEKLDETVDAVVVAGGNSTLTETVTGLLRRCDGDNPLSKRIPIGVLPLGRTNIMATLLFKSSKSDDAAMMAQATMAVIRAFKKPVDVIKVEPLGTDDDQRPLYSVSGFEWGALYDAYARRDKYWYWGALRSYVTYIFMGFKGDGQDVTWNCTADLAYSLPCAGCSHCYLDHEPIRERKTPTRWWSVFIPRQTFGNKEIASKVDYSKIVNVACSKENSMKISNVGFALKTAHSFAKCDHGDIPHIEMLLGPSNVDYFDFVCKGWKYITKGELNYEVTMPVKEVKLHPVRVSIPKDRKWFYIDDDFYEVKPIYLKLLPKKILMFCQSESLM